MKALIRQTLKMIRKIRQETMMTRVKARLVVAGVVEVDVVVSAVVIHVPALHQMAMKRRVVPNRPMRTEKRGMAQHAAAVFVNAVHRVKLVKM